MEEVCADRAGILEHIFLSLDHTTPHLLSPSQLVRWIEEVTGASLLYICERFKVLSSICSQEGNKKLNGTSLIRYGMVLWYRFCLYLGQLGIPNSLSFDLYPIFILSSKGYSSSVWATNKQSLIEDYKYLHSLCFADRRTLCWHVSPNL